jgi:hypothetical protein
MFSHKFSVVLGDPSADGHGMTSKFYISCECESNDEKAAYNQVAAAIRRANEL